MPITVHAEENIVRYRLQDPWTLDDLYQAIEEGYTLSKDLPAFFIIYELNQTRDFPRNFLSALKYMEAYKQDNVILRVMVDAPLVATVFFRMLQKIRPSLTEKFDFVYTLDEAIKKINSLKY